VSDTALFDQAVANLRGLREEMRRAAGHSAGPVHAQAVQEWTDTVDTAIADLLEAERRARYSEAFAIASALVDVTVDGPPASTIDARPDPTVVIPADESPLSSEDGLERSFI
jgi:hypothetical protein